MQPVLAFDGDYQIIYSADFNIYENKLILSKIADFDIEFEFKIDAEKQGAPLEVKGDNNTKKIMIKVINFNNPLGAGTVKKIPIVTFDDGKKIYFSIHAKSLNESTSLLKVSITFYLK